MDKNFEGYTPLRNKLLACPKMGNNDDYVDALGHKFINYVNDNNPGCETNETKTAICMKSMMITIWKTIYLKILWKSL